MKPVLYAALWAASMLMWAGTAASDPRWDESGRDDQAGAYASAGHRYEDYLRARDAAEREHVPDEEDVDVVVEIPPGHLPAPGECRDWYADLPAGHQPPPYPC